MREGAGRAVQTHLSAGDEIARRNALYSYLVGRGVPGFLHFTRVRNLESILRLGLHPKGRLAEMEIQYAANDERRIDGLDGVCLSVSFPNYKLFYKFRHAFPGEQWVILALSNELIRSKACIFNPKNAASKAMTAHSKERRMQLDALQAMFYDYETESSDGAENARSMLRASLGLPDHFTTDPQAEVVVAESIEPTLITHMVFESDDTLRNRMIVTDFLRNRGSNWNGTILLGRKDAFDRRFDHRYWAKSDG